jgi:dihydrofolate reductase
MQAANEGDIMGRIIATENITLDGVMQGPGRPDEDTRGGFAHGGWGDGYQDQVSMDFMSEGMAQDGSMLFGHRTYRDLLGHWTHVTDPNPFSGYLTAATKYVVSRTPDAVLGYPNSFLLAGEAVETVARLKAETEGTIAILGSGELVRSLQAAGLVDEYVLQIFPIVLGFGRRLFGDGDRADLTLKRSVTTTTGVLIGRYAVEK